MAVIEPKVHGAWNLHEALLENDLDFFVSLASGAGLVGNPGQSAYCATVTFLDACSSYRASLGLAGNTIDLGAVNGVGYLAERPELHRQTKKVSGRDINEKELLAIVNVAISGQIGKDPNCHSIFGIEYTGDEEQSFWGRRPMFSQMRITNRSRQKDRGASAEMPQSISKDLHEAPSAAAAKKLIYD